MSTIDEVIEKQRVVNENIDKVYQAGFENGKGVSATIEKGTGENALQQTLNVPTFTTTNPYINECEEVEKDAVTGEIISGAFGDYSSLFGGKGQVKGKRAAGQGSCVVALGPYSTAEGNETFTKGPNAHSEGLVTSAIGENSHSEGTETAAIGPSSHAQNCRTKAIGDSATSMGIDTEAEGDASLAGGRGAKARGNTSLSHGLETEANADYAFAIGAFAKAAAELSYAGGLGTVANSYCQQVIGRYNDPVAGGGTAFLIGNGNSDESRSNCFSVDFNGNLWFRGGLYMGGCGLGDSEVINLIKLLQEMQNKINSLEELIIQNHS